MTNIRPKLSTGEIYHIYNRAIGHENIFCMKRNLEKFIEITNYYRFYQTFKLSKFLSLPSKIQEEINFSRRNKKPLVEIFVFSLMPNHFHFLIKQLENKGITYFASNIQNSFAKYYNLKFDRVGSLFQSNFKARRIQTTEQFIHVSRYIHLNPVTSKIIEFNELSKYPWSSFSLYVNPKYNLFVSRDYILNHFRRIERYIAFVKNQVNYQRTLREIKKLLLD